MNRTNLGFNFQPSGIRELTQTDNAPLLFNSQPPGRKGRVTVFMRTRRTLRKRLGVHDLGQIEGVFQDSEREVVHDEMKTALNRMTQWRYLFPPEMKNDPPAEEQVDCDEFNSAVVRALAKTG